MTELRDYKKDAETLRQFFATFQGRQGKQKKHYIYAEQLERIANREQVAVHISLDDVAEIDEELADAIQGNSVRYQRIAEQVMQDLLATYRTKAETEINRDALDVYIQHRISTQMQINARKPGNAPNVPANQGGVPAAVPNANPSTAHDAESSFPGELIRRFEVYYRPRAVQKTLSIRQVRADVIGRLIAVHGVVTRTTGVKPLIRVATYTCDQCGSETYQIVSGAAFTPLVTCPSEACKTNKAGGRLYLQARGSKFVRFQELKVQELAEDVPVGHVPRSVTLVCTGENTRQCAPGDVVSVSGVYLPLMRGGGRQFGGLLSETFIDVHEISRVQKGGWGCAEEGEAALSAEDIEALRAETADKTNLYENLALSIAPEIYGHLDVKKALLLLLVGGVDRAPKGMHIRGNIHICLMGDPGVAKSQLLTYIERLAPRCQYTTGRGSSGVGLTAAVTKDPFTGEMVLEGGALVLADRGICCIDEFDKMQDQDRVAIHEVMEQQTISIAKAGILTTLSARVSILAAANPAYGRYNPRRSLEQNIDLPAALLSRFDLLWLIQDRAERESDMRLANHVTYIHTHNRQPPTNVRPYDAAFIRKYIAACQRMQPSLAEDLTEHIVAAYVNMRNEARNAENRHITTFVSPRTLLAILRLSTALARLRLSSMVDRSDVEEAIRLIEVSKVSLLSDDRGGQQQRAPIDAIYALIRELAKARQSNAIMMQQVYERSFAKGFTPDQVNECVDQYEQMNIWQLNPDRSKLIIVQ